ncbi:MAG: uracil-DNA glycosylase [Candidatus Eisenbacteria bacterium]
MSDDPRREAAEITRALRRVVERERAAGRGELLASSAAAAARGAGHVPVNPGPIPAPAPIASAPVAAPAPAVATRTPLPADTTPRPMVHDRATTAVATTLFGDEPAPASPHGFAYDLPSHFEPLHPNDLAERAQIHDEALPVLETVASEARACRACGLCDLRRNAVPGVGSARAGIVFVGEAPGADEDAQGEPFVGRAGQLLTRIIQAMDDAKLIPGVPLTRETVYICNVLKCRPPENRNPLPHEIESCSPYLRRQLEALRPRIICCLGKFAAELLVGVKGTIGGLRGKVYRYQGAKLIVTYHPAACLRNPGYKRPVWEDMQLLAREYTND